jgi:hypothetical protein
MSLAVSALLTLAPPALTQSDLDVSEAEAFLGSWDLALPTVMVLNNLDVEIQDQGGSVAASIGSEDSGVEDITDIDRSGDLLVLRYEITAQGQIVPVALTLAREGERLNVDFDFAQGMFLFTGEATRKEE